MPRTGEEVHGGNQNVLNTACGRKRHEERGTVYEQIYVEHHQENVVEYTYIRKREHLVGSILWIILYWKI